MSGKFDAKALQRLIDDCLSADDAHVRYGRMEEIKTAILAHIESLEKRNRDLSRYWLKKYKDHEEAANNKAADLQRENAALREQDELHWKTRKTLVAENAALKNEVERAKKQVIIEDSYRRQFQEAWMKSQQELAALRAQHHELLHKCDMCDCDKFEGYDGPEERE